MNYNEMLKYSMNKNIFLDPPRSGGGRTCAAIRRVGRSLERRLGLDYRVGFSEQTIEYPLCYQALVGDVRTVLDFGCVENILPIVLCNLGYEVTGLDFLPYPFQHPRFRFIQADILQWSPPAAAFDAVVSISTVEHVGLGYSGDPENTAGDRIAVEKMWAALKPGGSFYLTLPAGKPHTQRGYRTYDEARVRALVPHVDRLSFFAKESRYGEWRPISDPRMIETVVYEDYDSLYPTQAVAIIQARKP